MFSSLVWARPNSLQGIDSYMSSKYGCHESFWQSFCHFDFPFLYCSSDDASGDQERINLHGRDANNWDVACKVRGIWVRREI